MIILEGPDGSGKTTLKDQLLEDMPKLFQAHRHTDSMGPRTNLKRWVEDELSWPGVLPCTIYDRHPLISEPIYGPMLRGNLAPGFRNDTWYMTQWRKLIMKNPLIIFCLPPLEIVLENVHDVLKAQKPGIQPITTQVWYQYLTLFRRLRALNHTRAFRYDYSADNASGLYEIIREEIAHDIQRMDIGREITADAIISGTIEFNAPYEGPSGGDDTRV